MRSCVTISLVSQARGGPFVFWDDLEAGCRQAAELGFDAVEIFAPAADAVEPSKLAALLDQHRLKLAAMGTGAGWLIHRATLTHADAAVRTRAVDFIRTIIDMAARFGAPAIIGSMQGRHEGAVGPEQALAYLAEGLETLGEHAGERGVPLIYEPLNRYETNLINTLAAGVQLLGRLRTKNVRLLADLFHMNIEEVDLAAALRSAGAHVGHVHFVDSNRRPAGQGHLDLAPVIAALKDIGYQGYLSAEALPYPDPLQAARHTIEAFRHLVPS